ncbi:MAG TPA: aldo/keto reductase [Chloroflexota bacterium]|nr:aldo/keto reductase [Chloroflexota bacterium]
MEYRTLGNTGLTVSAIAFGGAPAGLANYLSAYDPDEPAQAEQVAKAIVRALELGVTYFDTALAYGDGRSERIFGEGRRRAGALGERMILATKVPSGKRTREGIVESAEMSLRNLGVERIDVLQLHGSRWTDEEAETVLRGSALDALRALKEQGKARFIGFTAETGSPGAYALIRSGAFDVLQIAYSILYQDACNLMVKSGPMIEARERGMGVVTMRSLSSGVFQKLMTEQLPGIERQVDLYALALGFTLSNPYLDSAIVGMRTAQEVEHNVRLVETRAFRVDLEALHRRYVER